MVLKIAAVFAWKPRSQTVSPTTPLVCSHWLSIALPAVKRVAAAPQQA